MLKLYKKLSNPIKLTVIGLLAFNMMGSMFLTGKEFETVYKINLKLLEQEQEEVVDL